MPSIIELHDSVVKLCTANGDDVVVRLSPAYLHRTTGQPGFDAGDVFTLDMDLRFSVGVIDVPFVEVPVQLADGCFAVGDATFRNAIPYPFDRLAVVVAEFTDCHGRVARISSRSLKLHPVSHEIFLESFPGSDA